MAKVYKPTPAKYSWLRWIGVLPAAVLACVAGWLFVYYINWFWTDGEGFYFTKITPFECAFVSGICFVVGGTRIAPKKPNVVALILMCLAILLLGFGVIDLIQHNYMKFALLATATVGSILAYVIFSDATIITSPSTQSEEDDQLPE